MAGKAVVINSSSGTGASVSFTSSGFGTPTGAIIFWSAATSSNADTSGAVGNITIWDGTNTYSQSDTSEDNQAKSDEYTYIGADVYLIGNSGAVDANGTLSITTDGITISWSDQPSSDWKCTVILFGGTGLSIHAGYAHGASNFIYSNASFEAQIAILFGSRASVPSGLPVGASDSLFHIGVVTNDVSITNRGAAFLGLDNSNDGYFVARTDNARFVTFNNVYHAITSFTATGFETAGAATAGNSYIFLLIAGLSAFSLNDTVMPAATGTTSFTGPGFAPDLVLTVQSGLPAYNTSYTTQNLNLTIGASDGTTTGGVAVYGTDGAATTDTANRHNTTLGTSDQTTAAEQWNYTLDSFDADGYNFDYTEVGTSGDIGFTLAIQFESAVTPITGYWAMDGVFEL